MASGDPNRALPGITTPPITESSDNWGAQFVYVHGRDGLRVLFDNEQEPPTYLVGGDSGGMIEIMPHRGNTRANIRKLRL